MYSLHDWVLHYLALNPDSLDGVCYMVWGKVYGFSGTKLSSLMREYVAKILDQYCIYNIDDEEYSLKSSTWAIIDQNWPYFSTKDRETIKKRKVENNQQRYEPFRSFLSSMLRQIAQQKPIITDSSIKAVNYAKLGFFCFVENEEVFLHKVAGFFIQFGLEDDSNLELSKSLFEAPESRLDLVIALMQNLRTDHAAGKEFESALLLGMSEEQFLSCLLRNSNLLKKIKEIEDSLNIDFGSFSDPFDVSYSYPSLFDIYSPDQRDQQ